MLIKNVHIENAEETRDVKIEDGKFVKIAASIQPGDGEQVIDATDKLLLPPFVDPHVHLDATQTAGDPEWNQSGTLFDGIRIWSERKKKLTIDDVKTRAKKALKIQVANGIQFVRSHVDVTDPDLTALKALIEVRDEVADQVELQLVAFPQEGILSYPNGKELMIAAADMGADVIGGIPHFEFTRDYGVESLKFLMKVAESKGKLVDVHCDEIDDPASRNLEVLATLALESGMGDKVTASVAQALRAVGEPVIGRAASQVSMGRLLGQLFEITALFDMSLRPELILLQKTMVSVEGVARRLNPDHDLWAAAKPVVERWIKRELGPQAQAKDALNELVSAARAISRLVQEPPRPTTVVIEKSGTPAWLVVSVTVAVIAALTSLGLSLWPYLH